MCGIAGIIDLTGAGIADRQHLLMMNNALRHRGPDDEGYCLFGHHAPLPCRGNDTSESSRTGSFNYSPHKHLADAEGNYEVMLAHRRLSVIDISSGGHQPMASHDSRFWLVFNGEIYNYKELKQELEAAGHRFRTHSDTEVLLFAWLQWRENMLPKLNGMWAFVIYDAVERKLFAARDRFGVKPFYHIHDKNKNLFAFASEQKALLQLPFLEKKINSKAAFDYLVSGLNEPESEGLFSGIYELMPSHLLELDLAEKSLKVKKYYQLQYNDERPAYSENKALRYAEEVRELFLASVKLRLRSDIPVGYSLSGGLDSSAIASAAYRMRENTQDSMKLFSSIYPGEEQDESAWAKKIVDATGGEWFAGTPSGEDLLKQLETLVYVQDIPFFSSSTFSHFHLMQNVAGQNIRVMLNGQGADELFAGYLPQFAALLTENIASLSLHELVKNSFNENSSFFARKDIAARIWSKHYLLHTLRWTGWDKLLLALAPHFQYLNNDFRQQHRDRLNMYPEFGPGGLNRMLHGQMTGPHLKVLLKTVERNAMHFSIECRPPFADDIHLIEKAFAIPSVYKIQRGQSKYIFREAMKGLVPEEIRLRKDKIGFATPEHKWLTLIKGPLSEYFSADDEFIDTRKVLKNREEVFSHFSPFTWRMINFMVWRKVFKV